MPLNKQMLANVIARQQKKYGKDAIYLLGSRSQTLDIPRVSTKIPLLDEIIGGGLPEGRIIELFGPESSGKTSLAYHLCSLFDYRIFIDTEQTADRARAKDVFGNNHGKFMFRRPDTAEQALETAIDMARAGMPLIVIDSVAAMVPKALFDKDIEDNARLGMLAKLLSENLPILASTIAKTGSIVLLINQVRDKISAMKWGTPFDTPGGRALKHYDSLKIMTGRKQTIVSKGKKVGIISKLKVVKSKVCPPEGEAELALYFKTGYKLD